MNIKEMTEDRDRLLAELQRKEAELEKALAARASAIKPIFTHNETETGIIFRRGDDRVEIVLDTETQRIYWVGKFDGVWAEGGGDIAWPSSLTEMLSRLGVEALRDDDEPTQAAKDANKLWHKMMAEQDARKNLPPTTHITVDTARTGPLLSAALSIIERSADGWMTANAARKVEPLLRDLAALLSPSAHDLRDEGQKRMDAAAEALFSIPVAHEKIHEFDMRALIQKN